MENKNKHKINKKTWLLYWIKASEYASQSFSFTHSWLVDCARRTLAPDLRNSNENIEGGKKWKHLMKIPRSCKHKRNAGTQAFGIHHTHVLRVHIAYYITISSLLLLWLWMLVAGWLGWHVGSVARRCGKMMMMILLFVYRAWYFESLSLAVSLICVPFVQCNKTCTIHWRLQ